MSCHFISNVGPCSLLLFLFFSCIEAYSPHSFPCAHTLQLSWFARLRIGSCVCLYVYKIYPQYGTIFCADHPLLFFNSHSFFNAFSLGKPAIPECGGCCCYSLGRFSNLTMPVRNPSHRIVCCILLYFYTQRHNPHFKSFVIRSTKSTCILFGCRLRYNTNIGQSLSTFAVTGLYAFVSTVPI